MVATAGDFAFSFLACLRCSAADVLLASQLLAPSWTAALHPHLSCAATSQDSGLMLNALREALRLSLNRFFGAPRERFPSCSSPNNSFLGSRASGIRTTCPAQRSCDCMSTVLTQGRPARVRTSVSGIFSCHLMPRSLRRLVVWKWFSFLACLW